MGTFVVGDSKVITIGGIPTLGGYNGLEVILRESGRFIIKDPDKFIAISEKKTRSIVIAGNIPAASPIQHFIYYDATPDVVIYETADIFPQELVNKYDLEDMQIYGILSLLNLTLTGDPADCICRLKGGFSKYWVLRQSLVAWNAEDCIGIIFSVYQTLPENGLNKDTEGVTVDTIKRNLVPIFTPIKSSLKFTKDKDKLYLYSLCDVLGHQTASIAGGSINGTCTLDTRMIIGEGFLPEEVEELLSPTQ